MKLKLFIPPLIFFGILLASIITQNTYLANIAIVIAWLGIIFFVAASILVFVGYALSLTSRSNETPIKPEKTHRFSRALLILIHVASMLLMASMGWMVTSIVYAIVYAFLMLLVTVLKQSQTKKIKSYRAISSNSR